jgi:hypothetical protein
MKTEQVMANFIFAMLIAVSFSFAAGSAAAVPNDHNKQIPKTCICSGTNRDQGVDQNKSSKEGIPAQKLEKKRPVDEVDWDKVFGETG